MADRIIVDPIFSPREFGFTEDLHPEASPVSTYVRPAQPAPSSLHGLASALSGFSQDLGAFVKSQQTKMDARDKVAGEAAAYKANGAGYAEAVRNGTIPSYNSPTFTKAYKEAQGSILGKKLAAGAVDAYQTWPQRNSQDPNDFDHFLGDYIKQNLSTDDPDVLAGAMPYIERTSDALYQANSKERSDSLYNSSISTHIASSSMDIDNASDVALTTSSAVNYDDLWSQLMNDRTTALASGIRAEDYDKQMVDMIHSKALEYMDPAILGMLKNKVPGKDYAYDDMDGSAQTMKTLDTMESRQARIESMKAQQQVKADKAELDTLTGSVLQQLAKDPQSVVDQRTIDRAVALGDGAFAVHVHEWAKTLSSPVPEPEDQNSILAIQRLIMSGAPMSAITDEIGHDITNPSTLNTLYGLYNTVNSRDMGAVLQNATVKQVLTYLRQSFVSADVFTAGGDTPDGIQAETDFTLAMAAWYRKHPDADYTDIAAQATKVLKDMQSTLQSISPDRPYIRPNAISQDIGQQQQPIGVKPPALTAEAAQFDRLARGERVTGSAADPWSGSTPPSLKQLPQDQQDKINQRAATLGIDPQIMTDAVFKHLHSQPGGYRPPQRPAAVSRPNSGHGVASPAPADGLPDVGQGDVVQDDNGGVWDAQTGTNLIAPKVPTSLLQQLLGGYPSTFDMYYAEPTSEPSSSALDAINEAAPRGEPVIGGSRSWRNNNPGNMEFNAFTQAHGATGSDGRFAIFPDEATGKAAMEARLFADPLYAGKTIEQAIHTWAPASDGNQPDAYAQAVAKAVGMSATAPLAQLNQEQRQAMLAAMQKQEGWTPGAKVADATTINPIAGNGGVSPAAPAAVKDAVASVERNPAILDKPQISDESATTSQYWNFGSLDKPVGLIIHHTGGDGTWQGVVSTFRQRNFPAHFVIDRNGVIHQILRLDQQGQHIKPANDGSGLSNRNAWGVEIIAKDDADVNSKQIIAAMQLVRYLHTKGLDYSQVRAHGIVNKGHKQLTEGASVVSAIATLNQAAGSPEV